MISYQRQTIDANIHFRKHLIYLKILLSIDRSLILLMEDKKGEQAM